MNATPAAGGSPPSERTVLAATTVFLFAAPFSASAGLRAASLIVAALALAFAARRVPLPRWRELPRGLVLAWLAWSLLAFASLAWTRDAAYTAAELRAQVVYGTLALFGFYLAAREVSRWRPWVIALAAGSFAAFVAQFVQESLQVKLSRHPIAGGDGPWSTHLVLIAPVLLALAWPAPWGLRRSGAAAGIALAVVLLAAWESGNRMVWAALAAELAMVAMLWRRMPAMAPPRERVLKRMVALAGLALGVAFVAAVVERNELHFGAVPVTTHLERDLRPRIWAEAGERIREAPWFGHGYGREILADRFAVHTPPGHPEVRHAHNVFADAVLQLGAVGLAAFLLVLSLLAREYATMLRDPQRAPWAVIGLAVLAGFLVKNLTDDFLHRHNALVFWAIHGALLGLAAQRRGGR